jgi:hypothetical protein
VAPFDEIDANAGYFLITLTHNETTDTVVAWLKQQAKLSL